MLDKRGHVGTDEHLVVADAQHQGRGTAGRHEGAGVVGIGEHEREMPLKPAQHGKYGADEVIGRLAVPIRPRHQVRRDLGIGVAGKLDTAVSSSRRKTAKFSMMPLWTTAILPAASRCGCALRSVGRPWVAQRVWPRPVVPDSAVDGISATASSRLASRPARRRTVSVPPSTSAMPDES